MRVVLGCQGEGADLGLVAQLRDEKGGSHAQPVCVKAPPFLDLFRFGLQGAESKQQEQDGGRRPYRVDRDAGVQPAACPDREQRQQDDGQRHARDDAAQGIALGERQDEKLGLIGHFGHEDEDKARQHHLRSPVRVYALRLPDMKKSPAGS